MSSVLKKYYDGRIKHYLVEKKLISGMWSDLLRHIGGAFCKLDTAIAKAYWKRFTNGIEVSKGQVMFFTYQREYACNPKYVCEELLRRDPKAKIVWVYGDQTVNMDAFPYQVKLVKYGTYYFYRELARSEFWIDNAHNFTWEGFPKKESQTLINLWHGSMGLKRIDPNSDSNKQRRRAGMLSGQTTTYCISNSDFEENVFRTSYWPHTEFKRYGHARNDILFCSDEERTKIREQVCDKLGIDPDCKLMLYAPTFRDNPDAVECFDVDYAGLRTALTERFGGEWVIMSRLHFHTRKVMKASAQQGQSLRESFVVSATDYGDMQELIAAADAALTDYSSWICDFVLTGRPGFLFTVDKESYVTERGFYYPLETTPFPIAENNEQLMDNIRKFDEKAYQIKSEQYLRDLGCGEDGHAAERIVDLIKGKKE